MTYRQNIKPALDFILAILLVFLFSPLAIPVALILAIHLKGNPLFVQKRPGRNARIFKLYKFRTMTHARDNNGNLLPDDKRLTTVGKLVRKTSLDELPQLINILKGEMSFVGPRPLLPEYLALYNDHQKKRHRVKPGITGWAQVNGRNAISWQQKFDNDVYYVDNLSFTLDLQILWKTVLKTILASGVNQQGQATTEPFQGNP